jgi:hypothetical protein
MAQDAPSQVLIPDRRVAAADAEVGRGKHHADGHLAKVEIDRAPRRRVVRLGGEQRDGGRRSGDVPGAMEDTRQLLELMAVRAEDEVPALLVGRGR